MEVDEELEVLQAIYCKPGEIDITHDLCGGKHVIVNLLSSQSEAITLQVRITVSSTYPNTSPEVSSLSSQDISSQDIKKMRVLVDSFLKDNPRIPVLTDIVGLLSDQVNCLSVSVSPASKTSFTESEQDTSVMVIHFDHMRSKTHYIKQIKKWTEELNITGRLFFWGKLILLLLIGNATNLKEYVHRNRTTNVDVDSKGKKCKERLLSILCEEKIGRDHLGFDEFTIVECDNCDEIEAVFSGQLHFIYHNYISQIPGYGFT